MGRLITEARVVAAMERFDLALVLGAVRSPSRARILWVLFYGPATAREIKKQTGIRETTLFKSLQVLMDAGLIVSREKVKGYTGRSARVYEIAPGGRRTNGDGGKCQK